MDQIVWHDKYKINVENIDKEHKKLFSTMNRLLKISQEDNKREWGCREGVKYLKNHAREHFEHEEAYMKSIGYKKMFTQLSQHNALRETIEGWDLDAIDENQDEAIEDMLRLITDWLVNHILSEDKQIGK